jgi:hypothetical protein
MPVEHLNPNQWLSKLVCELNKTSGECMVQIRHCLFPPTQYSMGGALNPCDDSRGGSY